jgi:3-oxoadipate CoA-transferase, alpha subunit
MKQGRELVMIANKVATSLQEAVQGICSGATIFVSGFGEAGAPLELVEALVETDVNDLTIVSNNAGFGDRGIAALFRADKITKLICSFPRSPSSWFPLRFDEGKVELELVPQGTLTERIRAAGAGIGAFYTPTGAGTLMADDKEVREIDGRLQLLEYALPADVALIKGDRADRWGNLTYRKSARNYAPTMAAAAQLTIAQVRRVDPLGSLSPEEIVTPGVYVDRLVVL